MIRVYVAGPIGANDEGRAARVQAAVDAGLELLRAGLYPFVPHLWAASTPHADAVQDYESWMRYDFSYLDVCDALVRIPGHSPGADREVDHARVIGIRIFRSVEECIEWASR